MPVQAAFFIDIYRVLCIILAEMRVLLFILCIGCLPYVSYAQGKQASIAHRGAALKFTDSTTCYNAGIISKGREVQHKFEFINVGDEPLLITDVLNGCACGNAEWTHTPILPGKKGFVIEYINTEGINGDFVRDCYVRSNAVNSMYGGVGYQLFIKGIAGKK